MNSEGLTNLRHSCAHLLAAAVLELWPGAKQSIGPSTDDGFYYDIDFGDEKVSEDDFRKIEKKMQSIVQGWRGFERSEVTTAEAKKLFRNNPYKLELIDEILRKGEQITLYKSGSYVDLCRGGHIEAPARELKHFKLLSIAGAYWRGDEKNKMLTRIYGTAFPSNDELQEYLKMQDEARKRDHKKLGRELDLFVFSETVGKGLPLWTPKGATIKRILERFITDEEIKRGYLHVNTPDIAQVALYEKSGHYPFYKESMYAPIVIDNEQFMLRPMSCPHHFELYLSRPHSYKDLPVRYAEVAKMYRYEQSGELQGLQRVRTFELADAHIIARHDQAEEELHKVLDLIEYVADVLGLKAGVHYHYRLSLGDRNNEEKYYKDDKSWDHAESVLRTVLERRKSHFVEAQGEAAFYGPKIDIQMKNVNGKEDTAFTVQYDFVMPKRFNLKYTAEDGAQEQPIVIHRSSIGAIERVMAFLIEHYAGAFPLWLTPVQVALLPVSDKHNKYAKSVYDKLKGEGIRVELDSSNKMLGAKIRESTLQKVPYMGIIGDKESEKGTIAVRTREGKDLGQLSISEFTQKLKKDIETFQ